MLNREKLIKLLLVMVIGLIVLSARNLYIFTRHSNDKGSSKDVLGTVERNVVIYLKRKYPEYEFEIGKPQDIEVSVDGSSFKLPAILNGGYETQVRVKGSSDLTFRVKSSKVSKKVIEDEFDNLLENKESTLWRLSTEYEDALMGTIKVDFPYYIGLDYQPKNIDDVVPDITFDSFSKVKKEVGIWIDLYNTDKLDMADYVRKVEVLHEQLLSQNFNMSEVSDYFISITDSENNRSVDIHIKPPYRIEAGVLKDLKKFKLDEGLWREKLDLQMTQPYKIKEQLHIEKGLLPNSVIMKDTKNYTLIIEHKLSL